MTRDSPHTPRAPRHGWGTPRVLVIPGLHDSGPGHWQTWLQRQYRHARRVHQQDWHTPDLSTWSARIGEVLDRSAPGTRWVAVAHSFGCLALAHHLQTRTGPHPVASALLVAPANPEKFEVQDQLPQAGLGIPSVLVGSENDPWMTLDSARLWAHRWGSRFHNHGPVGHINVESGHGPWIWARHAVDHMVRDLQRERRLERAHPLELHYAN